MTALLHAGHMVSGSDELTILTGLCLAIAIAILISPARAKSETARRIARRESGLSRRRRRRPAAW